MHTAWITHDLDLPRTDEPDERRWLLTNGSGGYAMGTVGAVNTHRYHGLLVAASRPPVGRVMALNQMLERLWMSGADTSFEFTTCLFRGHGSDLVHAPEGHRMLAHFQKGLSVAWTYRHGAITFVRELILHWKQQSATLRYTISGIPDRAVLQLHPMMTLRDFHGVLRSENAPQFEVEVQHQVVTVHHHMADVTIACHPGRFVEEIDWWYDFYYPIDDERGQECREDCFLPGRFEVPLSGCGEQTIELTVGLGKQMVEPAASADDRAQHLAPLAEHTPGTDGRIKNILSIAADDFVVDRYLKDERFSTILAGYPWFADWGRDTFIAFPGLLMTTGRFDEARATLRVFARTIRGGLVPNRFDDYQDNIAHYNTIDASMWFVRAAVAYVRGSGDFDSWQEWLGRSVMDVIESYCQGTDNGIAMESDGLITAGTPQTQLTWMDAACNGRVFTPRYGKAVEINALWHHGLRETSELMANTDALIAGRYRELADRVQAAFVNVFWDERAGHLCDHVWTDEHAQEHTDSSFRPNQIFAVALEHCPLTRAMQEKVIQAVGKRLLTPYGLKTLPDDDPHFHGRFAGPAEHRDEAYHQGTVWPWLIGPYAEAILRVGEFTSESRAKARAVLEPLIHFMQKVSIGQLHEVHEAVPPYRPVGCMAQAWSVAEVIRVLGLIERRDAGAVTGKSVS